MSAETLRRAAALMRDRAEALDGRRWSWTGAGSDYPQYVTRISAEGNAALVAETFGGPEHPAWEADHIAAWDPRTALAVADWLDGEAAELAEALDALAFLGPPVSEPGGRFGRALAVANTYMGDES